MQTNSIHALIVKRSHLLSEMSKLTLLLHGSWMERYSTCVRKNCTCHNGQRHGPHYCIVVNEDGRQRQKYIPQSMIDTAKAGLAQYKRLQELVRQITTINLAIMKERARNESR
jgi:hypothetical protein